MIPDQFLLNLDNPTVTIPRGAKYIANLGPAPVTLYEQSEDGRSIILPAGADIWIKDAPLDPQIGSDHDLIAGVIPKETGVARLLVSKWVVTNPRVPRAGANQYAMLFAREWVTTGVVAENVIGYWLMRPPYVSPAMPDDSEIPFGDIPYRATAGFDRAVTDDILVSGAASITVKLYGGGAWIPGGGLPLVQKMTTLATIVINNTSWQARETTRTRHRILVATMSNLAGTPATARMILSAKVWHVT